jgi:hypothetical protein
MPNTSLYTASTVFRKVLTSNSANAAYATKIDVVALPTSAGYINLASGSAGDYTPNSVLFKFYGTNSDNQTGNCRVYGLRPCQDSTGTLSYTHVLLGEWAFTLSAALTGVAGGLVGASEYYADTVTRTYGIENVSDQLLSPTGDVPAQVLMDAKGHSVLFVEFKVGTATNLNALYAGV